MEKYSPKIGQEKNSAENESRERFEFAELVRKNVLETFPFDDEEQRNVFSLKLEESLRGYAYLSEDDFLRNIRMTLASLEDTHTVLKSHDYSGYYFLEREVFYEAGKFWIKGEGSKSLEIVEFDGTQINDLVEEKKKEIGGGSSEYKNGNALYALVAKKSESPSIIMIKDSKGEIQNIEVNRISMDEALKRMSDKNPVKGDFLPGNVGYLKIDSWSEGKFFDGKNMAELAEEELNRLLLADSFIIDIRKNNGGSSELAEKIAGRFIDEPRNYTNILKNNPAGSDLKKHVAMIGPHGNFIDKKVVLLTGSRCLSSNEHFIMMLKDTGRAITIGQATGGGSGNAKRFDMSLGEHKYTLNVSTWRVLRNNGKRLENVGIEPDIPIEETPEDVANGRDVVLEEALSYLHSKNK